jgi:GDP-L-fucose synthase
MIEGSLSRPFDLANKRVYVAGHGGMVGSAIVRRLKSETCTIIAALSLILRVKWRPSVGSAPLVRMW